MISAFNWRWNIHWLRLHWPWRSANFALVNFERVINAVNKKLLIAKLVCFYAPISKYTLFLFRSKLLLTTIGMEKKQNDVFPWLFFFLFDDEIQPLIPTHDFIYLYSKRSEITLCEMRRVQVLDRCVHWLIAALCSSLTLNNYLLPPQKSRYVHSGRPKSTLQYFAYTCTQ